MKKQLVYAALGTMACVAAGSAVPFVASASPTPVDSCTHGLGWYKTHTWAKAPDLTPKLTAALIKKTNVTSIHDVLTRPTLGDDDVIAGRIVLVTALNGSTGPTGFTGKVGDAFYTLVDYYEGRSTLTKDAMQKAAEVLDSYNAGRLGMASCA